MISATTNNDNNNNNLYSTAVPTTAATTQQSTNDFYSSGSGLLTTQQNNKNNNNDHQQQVFNKISFQDDGHFRINKHNKLKRGESQISCVNKAIGPALLNRSTSLQDQISYSDSIYAPVKLLKIKTETFDNNNILTTVQGKQQISNNYLTKTSECSTLDNALLIVNPESLVDCNNKTTTAINFHNINLSAQQKISINTTSCSRPSSNLSSMIEQQQKMQNNNNCIANETNITLWQFLLELLSSNEHSDLIQWTNKEGEFKVNYKKIFRKKINLKSRKLKNFFFSFLMPKLLPNCGEFVRVKLK